MTAEQREIFRRGSKTYFNSSRFFPPDVRDDVTVLYGFVRVADDFVDRVPQDASGFHTFVEHYEAAIAGRASGVEVIDSFVELTDRRSFDPAWTDAFLRSMEWDLTRKTYQKVEETLEYIYGSAEVIGLYMARILTLPREADHAARMLGRAMQFINFIRDIAEDNQLGRTYLPIGETTLESLREEDARHDPEEFRRFVNAQLDRYRRWQAEAEQGYRFIPARYLTPIKTAGDMYNWTGRQIAADPFQVFQGKIKPSRARIVVTGLGNRLGFSVGRAGSAAAHGGAQR